jgi:YbbR domain-containing protein
MSRNIAPKIVSILFALVLWIYVMNTFNPTEYRNFPGIPVRLMNVEELKEQKLAVKDNADFKARVKLIARRDELDKVLTEQIQIRADLRGYGEGINNIPLEVITPNNIKADVTPRFIRVELERIISEQREVKVITSGVPKDNFIIGNLEYRPTVVWIEGAESHVNLVKSVIAQLDVTGKSGNVVLNLPLKPVNNKNEEVTDVDIKTSHVDVSLSVDALKSVPIKPDLQITTEAGYAVTNIKINPTNITPASVCVSGLFALTTQNMSYLPGTRYSLYLPNTLAPAESPPISIIKS